MLLYVQLESMQWYHYNYDDVSMKKGVVVAHPKINRLKKAASLQQIANFFIRLSSFNLF
jgi:hypothetical protein